MTVPAPDKAPPLLKRLLGIFGLVGGALLIAALVLAVREWRFLSTSDHATATVSRIDREWMQGTRRSDGSTGPGNMGYRVVATFPAGDGTPVEVRSSGVTSYTSHRVGDPIEVDYPPGRPDQAQLARFVDRWLVALILGGIGAAMVAICGFAAWLMRQPGTRITSNGFGGFAIRSATPVFDISRGPAPPDANPATHDALTGATGAPPARRPAWRWLAAMLVVGMGIGLVAAKFGNHGAANETPPAPGYPPHLTVKEPAMTDGDKAATPGWTGNGGTSPDNPTMAARAFLARPDQDAAMQAALRAQVARLGLDCPAIAFVPDETLVIASPAPAFDENGTLVRGLIRQRFLASGCPGRSPQFNIWVSAPGGGAPIATVAGFPGTTRASIALMRDAVPIVLGMAAAKAPGCRSLMVSDTHLPAAAPADATAPWTEQWLVTGCGRMIGLTVRFIPEPVRGMTRIEVPAEMVNVLGAK